MFGGGERRERRRKKTGAPYDSFTFAAFPQWCKQQKGRRVEKRMGKRERGRRGVLLLWKNDAAAVLGGCRLGRDREWGERGGRGGEACSIRGEWCGFHGSYPIRRSPPVHRRPQYSKVTNSQCPIFPRRLHGCRCALTSLSAREEKREKKEEESDNCGGQKQKDSGKNKTEHRCVLAKALQQMQIGGRGRRRRRQQQRRAPHTHGNERGEALP